MHKIFTCFDDNVMESLKKKLNTMILAKKAGAQDLPSPPLRCATARGCSLF